MKKIKGILGLLLVFILIGGGYFGINKAIKSKRKQTQYQTQKVSKGVLAVTISGSGTITSGNNTNITTAASGTIKKVYVKNGDTVVKGQKIAELVLDDEAKKLRSNRWIAYLDALEAVKTTEAAKVTADIQMWEDHQEHLDALEDLANKSYTTTTEQMVVEKTVDEAYKTFKASELKYNNYDARIDNAKVKLAAALKDYNEYSPIITAPASGVVNNLVLATGIAIENTDTGGTTASVSSQNIGIVSNTNNQFQATINLTESDITKIKADQKVNLTLDAFSDKTFTGKVLAINTNGTSSSGVTSYPVTILFDPTTVNIYPKMAVSAEVIISINSDVLLVPNEAIQTIEEKSYIMVKKDGKYNNMEISLGETNGTNTAVISGLNEGDEIVINNYSTDSASQNNTDSVFSGSNRNVIRMDRGFPGM